MAAIADARNHVVGDLGDVAVNESKFTAAVAEPDESIMLESAATLIAALVQNLADLRGERSKQLNARA